MSLFSFLKEFFPSAENKPTRMRIEITGDPWWKYQVKRLETEDNGNWDGDNIDSSWKHVRTFRTLEEAEEFAKHAVEFPKYV